MLFKTEEEKLKFKEEQEKKLKSYEKLEKKIFSNPKIVVDEIDKKNNDELRHVLFVNKEDFCFEYFKTLPEDIAGEDEFIKIFNFTFSEDNHLYAKSKLMLIDDLKKYIEIATDKRFVRAIDAIVSFFENKIEVMGHLKLTILTSIINGNNTFLDFLFTKTGDSNKQSRLMIDDKTLWEEPRTLKNIINYQGIYDSQEDYQKLLLQQYKHIAFLQERHVDKIVSKMKILIQESKEIKNSKDEMAFIKKVEGVQGIFFLMNEITLNGIIKKFIERKELDVLFKYGLIVAQCRDKLNHVYRHNDFSDIFYHERQKHENTVYIIHKALLEVSDSQKKIEAVNSAFSKIISKYSKEEQELINKFQRRQDLLITLSEEKKPVGQQRKKI